MDDSLEKKMRVNKALVKELHRLKLNYLKKQRRRGACQSTRSGASGTHCCAHSGSDRKFQGVNEKDSTSFRGRGAWNIHADKKYRV